MGCTSLQICRPIALGHERTVNAASGEPTPTPTRLRHGNALKGTQGHNSVTPTQPPTPFDCGRVAVYSRITPYA